MSPLLHRSLEEGFEDPGDGSTAFFSVPVFLILLRETVEVCLILSTTFAYLSDNKLAHYKKYAIYGTVLGSIVFLIVGAALIAVFYTIKNNAFSPDDPHGKIFEGTIMLFSAVLISVFGVGMSKMFNDLNGKMKKKLVKMSNALGVAGVVGVPDTARTAENSEEKTTEKTTIMAPDSEAAEAGGVIIDEVAGDSDRDGDHSMDAASKRRLLWAVLSVTFFAVIREGLECVVFLAGMTGSYPAESIPIAAIMGIVVGGVVGYLFYRSGSNLSLKWFAIVSMSMLFMVAAGLVARSFEEWSELGANGGPYVWDARWCCATTNPFWGFLKVIFGYSDHPNVLEFMIYWAYWAVLLFCCWYFKVFNTFEKLEEEATPMTDSGKETTVAEDPIPVPTEKAEIIHV